MIVKDNEVGCMLGFLKEIVSSIYKVVRIVIL